MEFLDFFVFCCFQADQLLPLWSTSGTAAFTECLVAANRAVWAQLKTKLIRQLDQCLLLAQKINDLRTDFLAIHAYAGVPMCVISFLLSCFIW